MVVYGDGKFKTGGVYKCTPGIKVKEIGASSLIKAVCLDRTRSTLPWDRLQYRIFGNSFFGNPQANFKFFELIGGTPSCVRTGEIEADDYDIDAEVVSMYFPEANGNYGIISSNRAILKTGVLLFCATKLIILARRVKESMYAPGGIGFIAAQEDFDRAAKSQRIE